MAAVKGVCTHTKGAMGQAPPLPYDRQPMRSPPPVSLRDWLHDLGGGATTGLVLVVYALTSAALLLPGPLAHLLPLGLGVTLVAAAVGAAGLAWHSQLPLAVAGPDSPVLSLLAAMAATVAFTAGREAADVLLLVLVATLACALVFLVLGYGRLGMAVRYVPYPVVGGFLASTGWLVCVGALHVAAAPPAGLEGIDLLLARAADPRLLATVAIGLLFWMLLRRLRQPALLPLLIAGVAALLLGGLTLAGLAPAAARTAGWMFALDAPATWSPPWMLPGTPRDYDWARLASLWLDVLSVAAVATLTILLGSSGLELMTRSDISLDRELRTHGWLNLVSGLLGGCPAIVSVARSKALRESGARSRRAGFVAAAVCIVAGAGAAGMVAWLPKPVLAGFLFAVGLSILWEWVVLARRTMGLADWTLVMVILGLTAVLSFSVAVAAGVLASCVHFALRASRVGVVQHDIDGADVRSSVLRPAAQRALLAERRGAVRVLVLRGVIFFGTASTLLERLRPFLAPAPGRVLVLDFRQVASTDSSAGLTFAKIAQLAAQAGVQLVVSGAADTVRAVLAAAPGVRFVATLDQALDLAEEAVLRSAGADPDTTHDPLARWLSAELGAMHWARLAPLLQRLELAAGAVLLRQGDPSDATLYLVESGRLAVTLDGQGDGRRLASLMAGNIVGEMALYSPSARSATVTAEQPCVVWRLGRDTLEALHVSAPDTAMQVHALVVRTIAERVRQANATIAALQRGA